MPHSFMIDYRRCLDPSGALVGSLPAAARDGTWVVALYRALIRGRTFDAKAIALQRTGRLGTFASALGQEAVALGTVSAMRNEDIFVPSFREHAAQLWRGVSLTELFLYWGGDERGSNPLHARHDFPISVPVGSHSLHAAGVALAFKLKHEPRVAVAVFGDGATSKGDVAEAINLAGVWRLPVVFVINNNQWAISVPLKSQTAAETLAQKAIAGGISGIQVDGNDVLAVHSAVGEAIEKARTSGGATLVEAVTYRLGDHTTSDDASRYRNDAEVSPHWAEEPAIRLRKYLSDVGVWSRRDEERLLRETQTEIDEAADAYLAMPPQEIISIFDSTFAAMPADLAAQRASALAERGAQ
ncbi:MAG TPA: pyruvate dehydrogenase (acetyl-transferring) E1 component subunit alpha [Stellaceae bacterium]|jgi:2-oxoisovalerate dehydrogenase E1 component alpha subunit|nr:pyruvate dehydrogenase (acetyl-transferring) E1 component subunit alpha [Stellaceae bacterium]